MATVISTAIVTVWKVSRVRVHHQSYGAAARMAQNLEAPAATCGGRHGGVDFTRGGDLHAAGAGAGAGVAQGREPHAAGAGEKLMQMGALTPNAPSSPRPSAQMPSPAMSAPPTSAAYASALRGERQRHATRIAAPNTTPTAIVCSVCVVSVNVSEGENTG